MRPAKKGRSTGKRHRDLFQRGEEVFLFMDDAESELKRLREAIDRVDEVLSLLVAAAEEVSHRLGWGHR